MTTSCLLATLLLAGTTAKAQTADEILDKALAAGGGRAPLAKITSRKTTGTLTVSTPGGDFSGPMEIWNQSPNKLRRLINLDLSAVGAGTATIDVRFDGTTAWTLDSMRGDSQLTGSQLEALKNSFFPSPFLDYKEHGMTIALSGKQKVADKDAYVLIVTPKTGPVTKLLIDAETYLAVQAVISIDVPEAGGAVEQTTTLSDYREVDGVKVPFKVVGVSDVQTFTIAVTKVEHNVTIDPAIFTKPGAK